MYIEVFVFCFEGDKVIFSSEIVKFSLGMN